MTRDRSCVSFSDLAAVPLAARLSLSSSSTPIEASPAVAHVCSNAAAIHGRSTSMWRTSTQVDCVTKHGTSSTNSSTNVRGCHAAIFRRFGRNRLHTSLTTSRSACSRQNSTVSMATAGSWYTVSRVFPKKLLSNEATSYTMAAPWTYLGVPVSA